MANQFREARVAEMRHGDYTHWESGMAASGLDPALMLAGKDNPWLRKAMIDAGNAEMEKCPRITLDSGSYSTTLHWGMYISVPEQLEMISQTGWHGGGMTESLLQVMAGTRDYATWDKSPAIANVLAARKRSANGTFTWLLDLLRLECCHEAVSDTLSGILAMRRVQLENQIHSAAEIESISDRKIGASLEALAALWYFPRWRASPLRRAEGKFVRIWPLGYKMSNDLPLSIVLVPGGKMRVESRPFDDFMKRVETQQVHYAPIIVAE